jgi:hypothetical protein
MDTANPSISKSIHRGFLIHFFELETAEGPQAAHLTLLGHIADPHSVGFSALLAPLQALQLEAPPLKGRSIEHFGASGRCRVFTLKDSEGALGELHSSLKASALELGFEIRQPRHESLDFRPHISLLGPLQSLSRAELTWQLKGRSLDSLTLTDSQLSRKGRFLSSEILGSVRIGL